MSKIDEVQALVDFDLRGYQREILTATEENKFTAFYLGRRMGKSTLIALDAIYNCLTRTTPTRILIGTQNTSMRDRLFETIIEYSRGLTTRIRNSDVKETYYGANVIKVMSFPQGGNRHAVCGENADIIYIDEADFMSNDAMDHCVMPIYNTNPYCRLILISTMSGVQGTYFKQFMTDRNLTHIYTDTFNARSVPDMDIYMEIDEGDFEHLGYMYIKDTFYIRHKKEINGTKEIYAPQ